MTPEEDRAIAIGNMHNKLGKDRTCGSGDIFVDTDTHTHTHRRTFHNTSQPLRGLSNHLTLIIMQSCLISQHETSILSSLLFALVDCVWVVLIVWRITGKIYRNGPVSYCLFSFVQWYNVIKFTFFLCFAFSSRLIPSRPNNMGRKMYVHACIRPSVRTQKVSLISMKIDT